MSPCSPFSSIRLGWHRTISEMVPVHLQRLVDALYVRKFHSSLICPTEHDFLRASPPLFPLTAANLVRLCLLLNPRFLSVYLTRWLGSHHNTFLKPMSSCAFSPPVPLLSLSVSFLVLFLASVSLAEYSLPNHIESVRGLWLGRKEEEGAMSWEIREQEEETCIKME